MTEKIYLKIIKTGIFLVFLSVLFVFKGLLFPYITSKQIYFNILIEVLLIFWLALIVKYPKWRPFGSSQSKPRANLITTGLVSFFAVMILSSFFGVDFNLSFWGDVERMLGVFHILHFFAFYLIIISVMRTWKDWRNLLLASVVIAVIVSFYGIGQRLGIIYSVWGSARIISTIGNAAYVGAYAIFNICFSFILFFRDKNPGRRILYIAASFIILLALIFSGTRGAYLGFGMGVFIFLFLLSVLNKDRKIAKYSLIVLSILIVLIISILLNADSSFVKNNSILVRITHISMSDVTMQTRFISWKAAWLDFKNHPMLGTGHGNYAIIFDKYFEPTFYNFTRTETYFDRAHNNMIDIVSTTGLLGILTYLFIFIAVGYYLIKGFIKNKINLNEFALLSCLIIAYFIQNLVVFDSLVTYIALMVALGYVYWLSSSERTIIESAEEKAGEVFNNLEKDKHLTNKEIYTLLGVGVLMLIVIYQFNIKPILMLNKTIDGQLAFNKGDIAGGIEAYRKALSYNTVLDRDSRFNLIRTVTSMFPALQNMDKQEAQDTVDFAIDEAHKNIRYNPSDSMNQMLLAIILESAAKLNYDNNNKFYFFADQALEAINKSIESSPGRIQIYFSKAQIYLTRGEIEKAIETLEYAVSLNEDYYDSFCQLAKVYFSLNKEEEGYNWMDKCIEKGGLTIINSADFIRGLINRYLEIKDSSKLLKLYVKLSQIDPENSKVWVDLSKLYFDARNNAKSIEAAKKAAELDKSLEGPVNDFIKSLEN
ncbi:MAG: O-antigen ligase family protein [Patescibacteria group bacterium]